VLIWCEGLIKDQAFSLLFFFALHIFNLLIYLHIFCPAGQTDSLAGSDNCLRKVATYFKGFPEHCHQVYKCHLTDIIDEQNFVLGIGM